MLAEIVEFAGSSVGVILLSALALYVAFCVAEWLGSRKW